MSGARGFGLACAAAIALGAFAGLHRPGDDPARVMAVAPFEQPWRWQVDAPPRFAFDARSTTIRAYLARSQEFAATARPGFIAGARAIAASEAPRGESDSLVTLPACAALAEHAGIFSHRSCP